MMVKAMKLTKQLAPKLLSKAVKHYHKALPNMDPSHTNGGLLIMVLQMVVVRYYF